jgi:hypothetical protein
MVLVTERQYVYFAAETKILCVIEVDVMVKGINIHHWTVLEQNRTAVTVLCFRLRLLCGAGDYPPNVLQTFETYCTNPGLVSPFHLQRRSTSTGVRDLCLRKVELWARKVRSNLAIQLRLPR